jgi:CBS domain containing-hemolysin-like protein
MTNEPYHPADLLFVALPLLLAAGSYVFFIVASLSIARSRVARLEELVEAGALGAKTGLRIVENSERYLLCTQMGRLCSSFGAGFCLAFVTGHIVRGIHHAFGEWPTLPGTVMAVAVAAMFMLGTLVCVQIAKSLSLQFPEKALCFVALPLRLSYALFGPLLLFIHSTVARVLAKFDVRPTTERDISISADDLSEIVKISSENGSLEKSEQKLIEGVVDFAERVVREVMTPRKDIVWAKETVSTRELITICTREAVSRVLISGADLDDVRGIILAKDLLQCVTQSLDSDSWRAYIRPTYIVPNTKPVDDLLAELRSKGIHLAVVLDEHGGVGGVVTVEDLLEQIVGEIFDETDVVADREPPVQEIDGAWRIDGAASIDDLPEGLAISSSEGQYDTIAGYLLSHVGRLPDQGETFVVEGIEFKVLEVHKHRIARLHVKILPKAEELKAEELPLAVNGEGRGSRKT